MVPDFRRAEGTVQQEGRARARGVEDWKTLEEAELMAGDEIRRADQIWGVDRLWPEAQVRNCDRTRLLRVIHEVALGKQVRSLTDDFDRVLVRADGPIGAEAIEQTAHGAGGFNVETSRVDRQAGMADVVVDSDGEVLLWLREGQVVEDRPHHDRRELFGRQPVAPTNHAGTQTGLV